MKPNMTKSEKVLALLEQVEQLLPLDKIENDIREYIGPSSGPLCSDLVVLRRILRETPDERYDGVYPVKVVIRVHDFRVEWASEISKLFLVLYYNSDLEWMGFDAQDYESRIQSREGNESEDAWDRRARV